MVFRGPPGKGFSELIRVRYAVLIYDQQGLLESLSAEEREHLLADYLGLAAAANVVSSACLEPVDGATTVRVEGGRPLVTDGPFAETKEVFGGLYIVEADERSGAVEFAARVPAARLGGSVEVRPLLHLDGRCR